MRSEMKATQVWYQPFGVSCSILHALNKGEVLYLVGTTDLSYKKQFSLDHSDGVYTPFPLRVAPSPSNNMYFS